MLIEGRMEIFDRLWKIIRFELKVKRKKIIEILFFFRFISGFDCSIAKQKRRRIVKDIFLKSILRKFKIRNRFFEIDKTSVRLL